MKAVDIIVKYIEDNGLSQRQAAEMAGMSPQNFWDKLNKGNPRMNSMERIMGAFGFDIRIRKADGSDPEFNVEDFRRTVRMKNPTYDELEAIINSMGYIMECVKNTGTP